MAKVESTAQNMSELLEVAAILVCKGYAQGTRKALYLACKELYEDIYEPNTYNLFNSTYKVITSLKLLVDPYLVFKGGYHYGKCWLDDTSKDCLILSLCFAKTYIDSEMVPG